MNISAAEEESAQEIHIPADIDWEMLDKSKFFFLGAALFSGVSATLYPVVLVKTRQQVAQVKLSGIRTAFSIVKHGGFQGLYRGFGTSLMGTIPARALYMAALEVTKIWWASYSVAQRLVWGGIGCYLKGGGDETIRPDSKTVMAVQGASAAMAGGISALITMPLDTIKTRLQVLDGEENRLRGPTIGQTVRNLVKEGGWLACYRGLGPRWASMSISATTMITTYEFLKRLSAKNQEGLL